MPHKIIANANKKTIIKNNCLCGKIRGERGVETHLKPMKIGFKCERAVQKVKTQLLGFFQTLKHI